jgi:hypothetical protein
MFFSTHRLSIFNRSAVFAASGVKGVFTNADIQRDLVDSLANFTADSLNLAV